MSDNAAVDICATCKHVHYSRISELERERDELRELSDALMARSNQDASAITELRERLKAAEKLARWMVGDHNIDCDCVNCDALAKYEQGRK